jgi:hypothetical protein
MRVRPTYRVVRFSQAEHAPGTRCTFTDVGSVLSGVGHGAGDLGLVDSTMSLVHPTARVGDQLQRDPKASPAGGFGVRVPQRPPWDVGKEGDGTAKRPKARTRGAKCLVVRLWGWS